METRVAWLRACGAEGGRVLDLGCGTGDHSFALERAGFEVTGLDFAQGMVDAATAKRNGSSRTRFVRADFNGPLPFAAAEFDHVFSVWALHYARDPGAVLAEVRRVMRPGGRLLVVALRQQRRRHRVRWVLWKLSGRGRGIHHFRDGELDGLLAALGYRVVDVDASDRRVVQLVAAPETGETSRPIPLQVR